MSEDADAAPARRSPPAGQEPWHIVITPAEPPAAPAPPPAPPGGYGYPSYPYAANPAYPHVYRPQPGLPPAPPPARPQATWPQPWPPYWPPPPPPPRRRGATTVLVSVIVVLVSLLGLVARSVFPRPVVQVNAPAESTFTGAAAGPYAFEHVNLDGDPARFDPCTAIHYVINDDEAPAGGVALVHEAVAHLGEASGLEFVYDGASDEIPEHRRAAYQERRYGDRWAPVLIAWVSLARTDLPRKTGTLALTSPQTAGRGGQFSIVSAEVVLDARRELSVDFSDTSSWGGVLLHELGHAVGLGHVRDRRQLMYPTVTGSLAGGDYADGDRQGLAKVGRAAGCAPAPEPG